MQKIRHPNCTVEVRSMEVELELKTPSGEVDMFLDDPEFEGGTVTLSAD